MAIPKIETFDETEASATGPSVPSPAPSSRSSSANDRIRQSGGAGGSTAGITTPASGTRGFLSFRRGGEYYVSTGRKAGDFFIGLFAPFVLMPLIMLLFTLILVPIRLLAGGGFFPFFGFQYPLAFLLYVAAMVLSFRVGRKWIGFGLLAGIGLSLLLAVAALLFLILAFGGSIM